MPPLLKIMLRVASLGTAAALPVGMWNTTIGGVPNGKLPDAPSLGNGYAGVVLADGPFDSLPLLQTVDLWLNTNANWGCSNNTATGIPGRLTPAVCSMVGFGGVSLAVPALLSGGSKTTVSFHAEQRIADGHLYTRQTSPAGTVETLVYMHPERNIVVANVTWTGGAPALLDVRAWVYNGSSQAHDSHSSIGGATKSQRSPGAMSVTRDATRCGGECDEAFRRMRTSLAVALPPGSKPLPPSALGNGTSRTVVGSSLPLASGATVSIVMALADNLLQTNAYDPTPAAQAMAKQGSASAIAEQAAVFWRSFWARSSISLPQSPEIEEYWFGALYGMATMTASTSLLASTKGLVPPSGLYGPWVTTDHPSWNGDFTLDYNQEAQYYGVFSTNREELAAAYFPPITQWMDAARLSAQAHAKKGGVTCPANALHFSCHLAPWGYQSHDQSEYMHWNGNFAALLFINSWEYTQNLTFAREQVYPLLEGLNAWWGCFLRKVPRAGAPGGYVYTDDSVLDPDNEHENQKVPNPQIGLALIRRSLSAQLSIATAIGATPAPLVADMLQHLMPFSVGSKADAPPSPPPSPPAPHFDCSNCSGASAEFQLLPGFACSPDYSDDPMRGCSSTHRSADCCAAMCANDPHCQAFTFCAGPGPNCPHTSCWKYQNATSRTFSCKPRQGNFTSGRHLLGAAAAVTSTTHRTASSESAEEVWVAFENATVKQSDAFALYPLWPSETVNGITATPADVAIAATSALYYTDQGGIGQRPVLEFSAAVRAGSTQHTTALGVTKGSSGCDPTKPATIVHALKHFLASAQRQSFLPSAPGGGTENVGITQAVNDMLVQAPDGEFIALFPVWDKSQDASFRSLLVKGAVEVSASWSAVTKAESGISLVARPEHVGAITILCTPTLCGGVAQLPLVPKVTVRCEGLSAAPAVTVAQLPHGLQGLRFTAPPGKNCSLVTTA